MAGPLTNLAKSKAAANRAAKQVSVAELEQAIKHLQSALKTTRKREADKAAKKRAADIKKLTAMMAEMGLSAADVSGTRRGRPKSKAKARVKTKAKAKIKTVAKTKAAKKKAPSKRKSVLKGKKIAAKYQIKAGGKNLTWTGRGRMPVAFREFIAKGGSLDKCLIKK